MISIYKSVVKTFALVGIFLQPGSAISGELTGTADIIDGDTIRIDETRIRLHGIDAPEAGQKCRDHHNRQWRCGNAATNRLAALATGEITCQFTTHDLYGRAIGTCVNASGLSLNETLIQEGLAWAFAKYSTQYVDQEGLARQALVGVWAVDNEPPWEYRARKWKVAVQISPDGCPIKGNISKNGRIYHPPWSPWYSRTKVSLSKGEKWFCSEADAVAAGWRSPAWR